MPSEASLANLIPWKPGQSGNPGYVPKAQRVVLTLARKNSPAAMQTIIDLLHDPDARVRLAAATTILERAWGKPKEHMHIDGAGNNVLIVTGVPRPDEQQVSDATTIVAGETTYTIEVDTTEDEAP